jgi:glycosyltransferase involved in cell wall biosynthesis
MKKRLAVIGGGAHTIPSYRAMLKMIAKEYEIILLSEFHLEEKWKVEEYSISTVPPVKNRWGREFLFLMKIIKICFTKRIDIIHSHSTYPSGFISVIVGRLFRIPVLVCLDAAEASGIPEIKFGDLLSPRRARLNRWVLKKASAITALTQFQCNEVRLNFNFKNEIHVIPRGVDPKAFLPEDKMVGKPVRFLSVAYIHPVKDQETLIRAFHLISKEMDASLTLVGKDYENGRIQKLAKELNIDQQVTFAGFVQHENIQQYYHQADILLLTSRYESQAMAAVEAMASGVMVCGTQVGIMADLSAKCCVTVPVCDYHGLASKVIKLVQEPEEQERLKTAALEWINSHSLQWTVQNYLKLYDKLIKH